LTTRASRIALPERCANVCFGGLKRNRLFMAASQYLYALYVNTQGRAGRVAGPRDRQGSGCPAVT
jgi:gluconolactonase